MTRDSARPDANRQSPPRDDVVLLDDSGTPVGRADRVEVHTASTPLHLAFSTYLFNARGDVLITRRALGKLTWPGVWTNSCCGHPRPDEPMEQAVRRRVRDELGAGVADLELALPEFGYRATDPAGIVENEFCPVWTGRLVGAVHADPAEVAEVAWVAWPALVDLAGTVPDLLSPWCAAQVPLLESARPRSGAA